MRLATWNLLHARSLQDGRVDPGRLHAAVATLDVDVLGIQEVDRSQPRSGGLDITATCADALAAQHWRFQPALVGTPGVSWQPIGKTDGVGKTDVGEPSFGVGLISRLPVRSWRARTLPPAPLRSPILRPGGRGVLWLRDEPRVCLAAVLDTPAGPVTVATTHLSFVPGWNAWQLRRLIGWLRRLPSPRVLLADLNLPGRVPGWLSRWRTLASQPTYPVDQPSWQLDHILADGELPPVISTNAVQLPLSDHRALVVHLADPTPSTS